MIAEPEAGRLLRYATLAASSHNTQPWRFELADDCIRVFADASRQLLVADPDRRELFLSVGCAVENLIVAAEQLGYVATVSYEESEGGSEPLIPVATVHLDPTPCRPSPEVAAMFRGIEARHTPRGPFVALPVPHALVQAASIAADALGARLVFVGDAARKQAAADVAAEAERVQFARDDFRRELAELVGAGAFGTPRAYACDRQGCRQPRRSGATLRGAGARPRRRSAAAGIPARGAGARVAGARRARVRARRVARRRRGLRGAAGQRTRPGPQPQRRAGRAGRRAGRNAGDVLPARRQSPRARAPLTEAERGRRRRSLSERERASLGLPAWWGLLM